jgi:hypothetical protein
LHVFATDGQSQVSNRKVFNILCWLIASQLAYGFYRHNIKRALKGSLLLHAALYFLLFVFAYYMYVGALETEMAVCPNGLLDEASLYAPRKDEQQPASDLGRRLLHKDHHPPHPPHPFKIIPWDELPAGAASCLGLQWRLQGVSDLLRHWSAL